MDAIITELQKIGFSGLEAAVYCAVLESGEASGYQISKTLGVAKSSVYNIVDTLVKKGALLQIAGETTRYLAEDPELLIQNLKNNFLAMADSALREVQSIKRKHRDPRFINLDGWESVKTRVAEIISTAEQEIILNIDFSLKVFAEELGAARTRGVRVVSFSWPNNDADQLGLEFYSHCDNDHLTPYRRIMIVGDFKKTLVASNLTPGTYVPHRQVLSHGQPEINFKEFSGVYSENPFLSQIIAEHIHHDIYLYKLKQVKQHDPISDDMKLSSLMEEGK